MRSPPTGGRASGRHIAPGGGLPRRAFLRLTGGLLALPLVALGPAPVRERRPRAAGSGGDSVPELVVRDGWVLRASDLDRVA